MTCRQTLRRLVFASVVLAAAASTGPRIVAAQDVPAAQTAVQTTLYFSLKTRDGTGVSEQAWAKFLAEVVTPRFPHGLTVFGAYGQGAPAPAGTVPAELTKVLVIVHPATAAEAAKIADIKAKYSEDFGEPGVFHTESDVRIVP